MALTFGGRVLVPAADPDDGERTARALAPRLEPTSTAIVVHVVKRGEGGPDSVPLEGRQEYAEEIFDRARAVLSDAEGTVETEVLYGADVVETVFDGATERDVDAVVFTPREGNRLAEVLTGDVARRMVKEASVPVVALPPRVGQE
ncbi:universal stress protein [Natrialbaceae archaeon GCM10025810]|uniref:universal stress protein n=1 Tax=Halovalidus salilacus TaxID=3075124 RepID=UPI00360E1022